MFIWLQIKTKFVRHKSGSKILPIIQTRTSSIGYFLLKVNASDSIIRYIHIKKTPTNHCQTHVETFYHNLRLCVISNACKHMTHVLFTNVLGSGGTNTDIRVLFAMSEHSSVVRYEIQ